MDQGMFYSALGVVWVFGFVAVVLIAWHLRGKRRIEKLNIVHQERMKAMEKGIPLPEFPELEKEEASTVFGPGRAWNPRWPLGLGGLLIMGGIGTVVALRLSSWEIHNDLWPFGLLGVFLGVGMVFYYYLTRSTDG